MSVDTIIAKLSEAAQELDEAFKAEVPGSPALYMALHHVRAAISRLNKLPVGNRQVD